MDGPQVYKLPTGLREGVQVRTIGHGTGGDWIVDEIGPPHTRWSVFQILLLKLER
ncbi:MAG TPA: hypothetical protein PLX89_07475 [Verrucomicrobiota bacterium]|nr:hypothetical protein [Verrucomicrobiota bacterium]